MRVRVLNRGYFGGEIRDPGTKFDVPDEIMADEDRRPSWVEPVGSAYTADEGPGDDDAAEQTDDVDEPQGDPAKTGKPKGRRGRKPKAAEAKGGDKPDEPKGNGIAEALGSPPDWLPPGGADALKGDDE